MRLAPLAPCLVLFLAGCGESAPPAPTPAAPATSSTSAPAAASTPPAAAPAPVVAPAPAAPVAPTTPPVAAPAPTAAPAVTAPAPATAPAIPPAPTVAVPAAVAEKTVELAAGLKGEYYAFDAALEDYPSTEGKTPTVTKVDGEVNIESTEEAFNGTTLIDQFYVRWTGLLRVPADGTYTFATESDDGSRLFVDGAQVVDNGGQHGMELKTGEIKLTAGDHPLKLEFFENGGGAGCKLLWTTPGGEQRVIPASALFHK